MLMMEWQCMPSTISCEYSIGKAERAAEENSFGFLETSSISSMRVTTQYGTPVSGSSSFTMGPASRISRSERYGIPLA